MNINEVEEVKLERYQALKWDLKKIWNCKSVKIIPIIIGALGTVNAKLGEWLKSIDIKCNIGQKNTTSKPTRHRKNTQESTGHLK